MTKDIYQANEKLRDAWSIVHARCMNIGIDIRITCVSRTELEQSVLYLCGRVSFDKIAPIYNQVFGRKMNSTDNKIITQTIYSKHVITKSSLLSRAIDYYIFKDGNAIWDTNQYLQIDKMFEDIPGIKTGRLWNDFCHVELI